MQKFFWFSRFQTALAHLFMVGRNSNWRCRPVFLQKVGGVLFGVFIFLITNEVIIMEGSNFDGAYKRILSYLEALRQDKSIRDQAFQTLKDRLARLKRAHEEDLENAS